MPKLEILLCVRMAASGNYLDHINSINLLRTCSSLWLITARSDFRNAEEKIPK